MASNATKHTENVSVLMVPFPLHGHLNQLLHLSCLISAHNLPVQYVATKTHNRQARRRIHGCDPTSISNIIFHEFPLRPLQSPQLNPNTTQFPSHHQPLFDAIPSLRRPVADLINNLCGVSRRVVIIHDSLMGSVIQDLAKFSNAESYVFHSVSAYTIFFFLWESMGRPFSVETEILENLPSLEGCFTPEFLKFIVTQHKYMKLNSGRIYNTCRLVEKQFLELLENPLISGNKKQWALGPFNPVKTCEMTKLPRHKCLKWLDRQQANSVILVSFGTTTSLSNYQIQELAIGLEKTEVKFLWVLREADGSSRCAATELPKGFEEKVKYRGMIVREWAPQLEILGHFAVGGFMTHCGWNSCMESISMGVPMAAWPMHSDQPRNTVLITEVLRIGVVVKDWARRDEIVKSSMIERALRKLMVSEEGEEMRRRAAEMGGDVRKAVAEGGLTRLELDSFISHITRS